MKAKPARKPAKPAKRTRAPKVDADTRRQAILDAALSVFAEHGFEAARLDEVAARAGVAKGTLYLYFRHKEALFEELVRSAVAPVIETLGKVATNPAVPPAAVLDAFFAMFEKEVLGTRRKLLLRLIIAEGPRFPAIAEFYYREVVSRGLKLMRGVAERAVANGEFATDAAGALSATDHRAAAGVGAVGRHVLEDRSARCRRDAACAPRAALRQTQQEHAMSMPNRRAVLLAVSGIVLAGFAAYAYLHRGAAPTQFQGWVEAEMLFISPDEVGRVETLSVREGQEVAAGAPLFALDADLQRAAVAENEAAVTNARITYQRAQELLKKAVGSQKAFDDAESTLRTAEARLNSAKTRLDRRRVLSPAAGKIQEVYYREGEMVQSGRPIVSLLPPGNVKVRFFVPQAVLPTIRIGDRIAVQCDGCAERPRGARALHLGAGRVHAARHLQPGGARAPGVPRRGHPRAPGGPEGRPARHRHAAACRGVRAMPANDMRNGEVVIDVEGLTKSFDGKVVVRNLSMQVKRGQIYGFLGPNGSGKTTTLRMLCGLLTPDSGRGTALGFDIRKDNEEIKRHVGYMTQRFSLYQDLSILENLEFVARVYGLADPSARGARAPSSGSACRAARRSWPAPCRAAGSSAWRSAPASCPSPNCSCSTSRPPASIPRRGASSGARSTSWPPRA